MKRLYSPKIGIDECEQKFKSINHSSSLIKINYNTSIVQKKNGDRFIKIRFRSFGNSLDIVYQCYLKFSENENVIRASIRPGLLAVGLMIFGIIWALLCVLMVLFYVFTNQGQDVNIPVIIIFVLFPVIFLGISIFLRHRAKKIVDVYAIETFESSIIH